MDDPGVAFDRVFAGIGENTSAWPSRRAPQAVLDAISGRYTALRQDPVRRGKEKLAAHMAALSRHRKPPSIVGGSTDGGTCLKPIGRRWPRALRSCTTPAALEVLNAAGRRRRPDAERDHSQTRRVIVDLRSLALTTMVLAPSRSDIFFNFINVNSSHHELSHDPDTNTASQQKLVAINQWYAGQVSSLVTALKSVKEGAGTLFDNTVVFWCNELVSAIRTRTPSCPSCWPVARWLLQDGASGHYAQGYAAQPPAAEPVPRHGDEGRDLLRATRNSAPTARSRRSSPDVGLRVGTGARTPPGFSCSCPL